MTIREVQTALAALGFVLGPIDGRWGRLSAAALKRFQAQNGLEVDGIIGPQSIAALRAATGDAAPAKSKADAFDDARLVWFQEARSLFGTKEAPGPGKNNRVIMDWASDLGITYKGDDVPWCGLFAAHCIGATLGSEPLPAAPLGARNWRRFGVATTPKPGAVMVFWRGSANGVLGHVGFYAGEDATAYRILGGNQSDSVSLAWINRSRFLEARWPSTVAHVELGSVMVKRGPDEEFSTNEA